VVVQAGGGKILGTPRKKSISTSVTTADELQVERTSTSTRRETVAIQR
jgi:hypothetical protein